MGQKYSLVNSNYDFKKSSIISSLNSFHYWYKVTDCSRTFDYICKKYADLEKLIKMCSYLDIYEISLNLDKNGIKALLHEFSHKITINPEGLYWEYGKLLDTLKDVYNIKHDLPLKTKKYLFT